MPSGYVGPIGIRGYETIETHVSEIDSRVYTRFRPKPNVAQRRRFCAHRVVRLSGAAEF
jgi:hypothetical protein